MPKTAPYKCKGRKMEFSSHKSDTSSEESVKHHRKQQESSEISDDNKNKKKYRHYEKISGEFKKIKPPMFNGEIENDEDAESCLFLVTWIFLLNLTHLFPRRMNPFSF